MLHYVECALVCAWLLVPVALELYTVWIETKERKAKARAE